MTTAEYARLTKSLRGGHARTETQERLVTLLLGGRMHGSDLRATLRISGSGLRKALGRMRARGWIVECDRDATDPCWSLALPHRTCLTCGLKISRFNAALHCYAHGGGWIEEPPAAGEGYSSTGAPELTHIDLHDDELHPAVMAARSARFKH